MSLKPSLSEGVEPVSKVTFSPINTEALVVSIRTIVPQPGEILKMEIPKHSKSLDSKRKTRLTRSMSDRTLNKSTMTEYRKEISIASQTIEERTSSQSSRSEYQIPQQTPCLKHAAENITVKANDMPSEKLSLCKNCSSSMLSYICLVQDFLDSLAKEICHGTDAKGCVQCTREQIRHQMIARSEEVSKVHTKQTQVRDPNAQENTLESEKYNLIIPDASNSGLIRKSSHIKDDKYGYKKSIEPNKSPYSTTPPLRLDLPNTTTTSNPATSAVRHGAQNTYPSIAKAPGGSVDMDNTYPRTTPSQVDKSDHISSPNAQQSDNEAIRTFHNQEQNTFVTTSIPYQATAVSNATSSGSNENRLFIKPMERQQPNLTHTFHPQNQQRDSDIASFCNTESISSPFGEETDAIISTLSNAEREVYDTARNGAGWEGMTEAQERLVAQDGRILSEAYVTMCRNNAEALGCLVVGTSLLLTHTSRTLCILISDGVSMAFREPLASVFHVVQTVRSLDSLGTTKLALLEQPELGISFDKLNVWRLKQFHKCVYLNPDTLVIQNCDELFNHEELSAVPDIGWPDCFNSGVFVFSPSDYTFWQLLEYSDKQGSFDGGDQGLLNSYFNSWSADINKKLSFIYNLMANVSYTYTPAFKQFGRNVKIVQFHGSFKPWHVKFHSTTGNISPSSNVHPTYEEFVNKWIKMFKGNALRQLSQEIQSYAGSQELICAVELLRFFPLPSESESEFFLTPPSVRMRLTEMKLRRTQRPMETTPQRRKSAEFPRNTKKDNELLDTPPEEPKNTITDGAAETETVTEANANDSKTGVVENPIADESEESDSKLPGAEVGNYQGMKKWEQGKMDYQGTDSSDSVIKRLEFLMTQTK